MKKNKLIFVAILAFIFIIGNVLAASTLSTSSVCCEKTTSGAYCLNGAEGTCDTTGKVAPTSCESTSFCKLGTCYDSKEGMCLENVPQTVCQANGGAWSEKEANQLSQCKLGCCVLADQASFVTMTRCKSLSTFYGMKIDFRPNVNSETACIAAANSQDEGACVSFEAGIKTCKFTTRQQCGGSTTTTNILNSSALEDLSGKYFYSGLLCSAEELGIPNSARQASTGCYEGKVYWFDSVGNRENVYSSQSNLSWNNGRVADPDTICAKTGDSKTCGNCDYLAGSRCAPWDTTFFGIGKPKNVDNYCKTTKCTDREGNIRLNGESWCVYDGEVGNAVDPAGSRHYREICVDGKVQVEACEDFRNQICIHSGIETSAGEYSVAACRVNRWQDCVSVTNKDDCENTDARDCIWAESVDGVSLGNPKYAVSTGQPFNNPVSSVTGSTASKTTSGIQATSGVISAVGSLTGNAIRTTVGAGVGEWEENELSNSWRINRSSIDYGVCVPMVSPGLDFWQSGTSTEVCAQASATCTVEVTYTYGKDVLTGATKLEDTKIRENECLTLAGENTFEVKPEWASKANAVCSAMGDCGAGMNFNEFFTNEGYQWKYRNASYYFLESDLRLLNQQLSLGTGEAVVVDYVINNKYKLKQGETVYVKA